MKYWYNCSVFVFLNNLYVHCSSYKPLFVTWFFLNKSFVAFKWNCTIVVVFWNLVFKVILQIIRSDITSQALDVREFMNLFKDFFAHWFWHKYILSWTAVVYWVMHGMWLCHRAVLFSFNICWQFAALSVVTWSQLIFTT